jgi:hypothetical protein
VLLTPVANLKKSSIRKVPNILFGHLQVVELNYRYIFFFKFTLGVSSLLLFRLFVTCVFDTSGKFTTGVVDTCVNLPPVSTPALPVANLLTVSLMKLTLATSFLLVSLTPASNWPQVLLIPVVHLDLRIPTNFRKSLKRPNNVIFRGLGEDYS